MRRMRFGMIGIQDFHQLPWLRSVRVYPSTSCPREFKINSTLLQVDFASRVIAILIIKARISINRLLRLAKPTRPLFVKRGGSERLNEELE